MTVTRAPRPEGAQVGTSGRADEGSLTFRPDIEGLRAVAVGLVVLGHAGVGLISGGYVGVDVFFVISGFLITSLLLREAVTSRRISIARFYARRVLRLLPAATVVLLVTLLGAWLWLSPVQFTHIAHDAVASAFYVINYRLAVEGTDYFASAAAPSPLQHFWSLAVEEQFYLAWPALIVFATWIAARRGRRPTATVAATLVPLVLASFALGVVETDRLAPWAYFGTPARAWELGVGALLAVAWPGLARLRAHAPLDTGVTWVGLATIVIAAVVFTDRTPFPGQAALMPVLGTALVLSGGGGGHGAGALLRLPPFQFIGRRSYGVYLWHWPLLVIAPAALGLADGVPSRLALSGVAVVLAAVSLRFLENPIRHSRVLRARPRRTAWIGLGLSGVSAAAALVVASAFLPPVPQGSTTVDTRSAIDNADDPAAVLTRLVVQSAESQNVPSNLTPTLAEVQSDKPASYDAGCHLEAPEVTLPGECAYGDTNSTVSVVLFGDSHAAQWLPTLTALGNRYKWRVLSRTKSSCNAADVRLFSDTLKRKYTECDEWRRQTFDEIARISPALVVTTSIFSPTVPLAEGGDAEQAWAAGWARTFGFIRAHAAAAVFIEDTPYASQDVPGCVALHSTQLAACASSRDAALLEPLRRANAARAAAERGVNIVDPTAWLCGETCPPVVGNLLVFRDQHHLTTEYATMLAPLIGRTLVSLVGNR